jgi:hypothetical protein
MLLHFTYSSLEFEKFGPNLLKNPSFEDIDPQTGIPLHWKVELLEGKCKFSTGDGSSIFP